MAEEKVLELTGTLPLKYVAQLIQKLKEAGLEISYIKIEEVNSDEQH